jgi:DNA-binding HxlR family transcriptional regulator
LIAEDGERFTATRAGALGLSLLSVPLRLAILESLARRPNSLVGLRFGEVSPSASQVRRRLDTLIRLGAVERRGRDRISGELTFGLTPAGTGLLGVGAAAQRWLAVAPAGPLCLGTPEGSRAIEALVGGWASGVARLLAAGPLSPTELGRLGKSASLETLEGSLRELSDLDLIEPAPSTDDVPRYRPTAWLRHAIAPLCASAHWEHMRAIEGAAAISRIEVEASFLLATPLVCLPSHLSGTCRVAVEVQGSGAGKQAGAFIVVDRGTVLSCVTRAGTRAESWASGSPTAWLYAVIEGQKGGLDMGGNVPLAAALLQGLHTTLFGAARGPRTPLIQTAQL